MIVAVEARLYRDNSFGLYACGEFSPKRAGQILVKTEYGTEAAQCVSEPFSHSLRQNLPQIIKIFDEEDKKNFSKIIQEESKALSIVRDLVKKFALEMKVGKASYTFDKRRLFVYYTAPSRVDFRNLIKEINTTLKTQVQMVQVSFLDCARIIGGVGPCGRVFCCKGFLRNPRLVKANPKAPIGPCGKPLCCWSSKYE